MSSKESLLTTDADGDDCGGERAFKLMLAKNPMQSGFTDLPTGGLVRVVLPSLLVGLIDSDLWRPRVMECSRWEDLGLTDLLVP